MDKQKQILQQLDFNVLFILLLLSGFSIFAVYSAGLHMPEGPMHYATRQGVFYVLGFIVLICTLFVDYRRLKILSIPFYLLGTGLLVAVMVIGEERKGAQRWIDLGLFDLQPSELMKVFFVIILAHLLTKVNEQRKINNFKDDSLLLGKIVLLSSVPFYMIWSQPDLGTAIVILCIIAILLVISGISWKMIFILSFLSVGTITGLVLLYFINFELFSEIIRDHQMSRIYAWLTPEQTAATEAYQLIQAMMAIGSGQLVGLGFQESIQGSRIPELHTDFIFAVIGEEFGFIGASILISLYFILIYRLIQIALTCNDTFGSYLVVGVIGMIFFQVFQNIGMTIGLMPITGLALPFISYGGSALLTNMLAMGIVLNVAMRTRSYMFE